MEFNHNQKFALVVFLGLFIAGLGLWGKSRDGFVGSGITVVQPSEKVNESTEGDGNDEFLETQPSPVVVHVAGEVKKPDVHVLPPGSRVIDAVNKAGGATMAAQLDGLNLAAPLKDGERIFVPPKQQPFTVSITPGQPAPPNLLAQQAAQASSTGKLKNPGDGVVNINTADAAELQRLPGVGPSTAQKIIDYRTQIGRFSVLDQLMDVKGIGPKKYEKMRPFICL